MAKKKTNGKDPAGAGHNASDLDKLIRNCAIEANRIKKERQELVAQMKDIRQRLSDSGVQPKVFEYAVRVAALEEEAQQEHTYQLELCFGALDISQAVDATSQAKAALDALSEGAAA